MITTILSITYTNELLVTLLNPMKAIHTDWHIEMIHSILNVSFDTYDTEVKKELSIVEKKFDYIPTIEVNISVNNMNTAILKLILNINMLVAYALYKYHRYLTITSSLYKKEMLDSISKCLTETSIMCLSFWYAHKMWAFMYFNISLHNYNELNFYEFDVDFDVNEYIKKYVVSLYIHMLILNLAHRHTIFIMLTLCMAIGIIQYFELIYYITIWLTITNIENITWKIVVSNFKIITYLKENYIVRIYRNNK
jgi:hypothetical protein